MYIYQKNKSKKENNCLNVHKHYFNGYIVLQMNMD